MELEISPEFLASLPQGNPIADMHRGGLALFGYIRNEIRQTLNWTIPHYFDVMRGLKPIGDDEMPIILHVIRLHIKDLLEEFDQYDDATSSQTAA